MKYEKSKDSEIKIRISSEEKILLTYLAVKSGHSLSKYLRLMIESAVFPYQRQIQIGDKTYDDFKTLCDNIVQQRRFLKK